MTFTADAAPAVTTPVTGSAVATEAATRPSAITAAADALDANRPNLFMG